MEKVPSLKLKKNKETPHLPPLKFSQNILEILNIDRKYIKQQCMQQKELLQEQLNESLAHDEKKLLQFLLYFFTVALVIDNALSQTCGEQGKCGGINCFTHC